jgi:hypothetical protein
MGLGTIVYYPGYTVEEARCSTRSVADITAKYKANGKVYKVRSIRNLSIIRK